MNKIVFETPGKVIAGAGCIKEIAELLVSFKGNDEKRALILCDKGIAATGIIDSIKENLEKNSWNVEIFDSIPREPDIDSVEVLLVQARKLSCTVLIGAGGGSVLDTAKLFGCMLHTSQSVADVLKDPGNLERKTFTCLIPTTAGTGSEATRNVILSNPEKKIKEAVIHSKFLPDLVLLDPELTLTLPPPITASTGLDALAHAIECYVSKKANALSDLFALDAIKRIFRSLDKAYKDGRNIEARTDMLTASYYAGMCISLSGTTAVHALSYPLGAVYHVPHGSANAMLLAPVIDFNKESVKEKLFAAADCFGIESRAGIDETVNLTIEMLYDLVRKLEIPQKLSDYNIPKEDIPSIAEGAFSIKRLLDNNPKEMSLNDIKRIYESIY